MNRDAEARLADALDQELALAQELSAVLQAEREALTGTSPEAVTARAAQKSDLIERFASLEARREALWAEVKAPSAAIVRRWQALLSVADSCRQANEINGYIIHSRQHQVRQLLDALRGGAPGTYGPQGQTRVCAVRALAQA